MKSHSEKIIRTKFGKVATVENVAIENILCSPIVHVRQKLKILSTKTTTAITAHTSIELRHFNTFLALSYEMMSLCE